MGQLILVFYADTVGFIELSCTHSLTLTGENNDKSGNEVSIISCV